MRTGVLYKETAKVRRIVLSDKFREMCVVRCCWLVLICLFSFPGGMARAQANSSWTVKPEDFAYTKPEVSTAAISAGEVVDVLLDKGSHADVIKLVTSYENLLYGIPEHANS